MTATLWIWLAVFYAGLAVIVSAPILAFMWILKCVSTCEK